MADQLETVDLLGVEILSTGGPVFGVGSPPGGDFWTTDDLRAMAVADAELGDEIAPPAKIGHSDAQRLLGLTDGEMPAVGWLENLRLNDDGSKLLADIMRVPKKFGDLVAAGGYRKRSVELSRVKSQKSGKAYDWVVTGLAWLGGKMPAVKTLDDVVALYEGDLDLELQRVATYEAQVPLPEMTVADVLALLEDGDEHVRSEVSRLFADALDLAEEAGLQLVPGHETASADTRSRMPNFTAEQRKTFAEATGLEETKVTDEMLTAAGVKAADEPDTDTRSLESDEKIRSLEEQVKDTNRKLEEQVETARLDRRRAFVEGDLLANGKIEPGQKTKWERSFDLDEAHARDLAADLRPNEELAREFGSDDDGDPATQRELEERDYTDDASARLGLPKEAIL